MGYSSEAIFIKTALNENEINDCLKVLGFTNHRFSGEVDFETTESHYDKIAAVYFS